MHCFSVLDNNQIIDLSDDSEILFEALGFNSVSLEKYISTKKIVLAQKNSVRCNPIGRKKMMNHIINKYPDHPAFSETDKSGKTRTQLLLTN